MFSLTLRRATARTPRAVEWARTRLLDTAATSRGLDMVVRTVLDLAGVVMDMVVAVEALLVSRRTVSLAVPTCTTPLRVVS